MNMYRCIGKLNAYVTCKLIYTKLSTTAGTHAFGGAIPHAPGADNKHTYFTTLVSSRVFLLIKIIMGLSHALCRKSMARFFFSHE